MTADVEIGKLISIGIATDGTAIRLIVEDGNGCSVSIVLTLERSN